MEVLNSLHNVVRLAFLATLCLCPNSGQEVFSIIRNPGNGNPWTDLDQFKLPESKCSAIECTNRKAFPVSVECHCECSYDQEATFGFYSGSWTCMKNTEVRTQAGCNYKFENEQQIHPLKIFEKDTSLNVILPSTSCSVDQKTSKYFTCDGRWSVIDSPSFSNWFSIKRERRVNIGSGVRDDLLGRIISLSITCPGQGHSCLLFKLKGTLQCNENVTSPRTTTTSPRTTTTSPRITTTSPRTTTTSPRTTKTAPAPNATANPNKSGIKEEVTQSGDSSVVVGVVVTMVIIVAIVIVVIGYVYWKRKRGENVWIMDRIAKTARRVRPSPKTKEFEEEPQEQVYAEIPEQPTQTPTGTKTSVLLTAGTVVTEEPMPTDDEGYILPSDSPIYAVLEDPNQQITDDGEGNNQQEHSRGPDVTPASVSGPSAADNKRYVTRQRRRPPSPPRKRKDTQDRQHDVNDGTDVSGKGEGGSGEKCDYESLKEDNNRDVYQALDRSTMTNR